MPALPSGVVTFMFTDIEGSTRLHQRLGPRYGGLIAIHDRLLADIVAAHGGTVVKSLGDGVFAAFAAPGAALAAAAEIQRAVQAAPWPDSIDMKIRIGLHAGEAQPQGNDYVSLAVHQAARICAAAHGGQIVVTETALADEPGRNDTTDLGVHRLKDFAEPVVLHQLGHDRFPPLRTMSVTNLPRPVSSFVGRADESAAVVQLITDGRRLVSLVGPGGCGKTRLAIEVASRLVDHFKGGVLWVDLKQVRDATQVSSAIATTVGAQGSLEEQIGDRHLLLVLDNLEQVVAAAPALAALIEACPRLAMLVTTRERLQVRGEFDVPVAPLTDDDAVTLFRERAGVEASEDVRRLCRALDRLPLGIELAAARARVLTVGQILNRLGGRLDTLKGGRDLEPRQQTLRATIGWSYELLDAPERELFARLAVFAGGCTLEAAEEVADADLDVLQSLVDKSLLVRSAERFSFLETIREYALERLRESGDATELSLRHARWFTDLVRTAQLHLRSADQQVWFERLRSEVDNLRAVLALALADPVADAFDLANALFLPWKMTGQLTELTEWYRQVLPGADLSPATRAATLAVYGSALMFCNQPDEAQQRLEESLTLYRHDHDELGEASVLNTLGSAVWVRGDLEYAVELREQAMAIYRAHDDKRGVAHCLHLIGEDLRDAGELSRAASMLEEAIAIDLNLGDRRGAMTSIHSLGDVWLDARDTDRARDRYAEALRMSRQFGDESSIAYCLAGLASVAALEGDPLAAGRYWGAAAAIEDRLQQPMLAPERARYEKVIGPLAEDVLFQAAVAEGRASSVLGSGVPYGTSALSEGPPE